MITDECAARMEIQHLITSWSVGCDCGDLAGWVWAEDAVVHAPNGIQIAGRDNILGRFGGGRYTYTTRETDTPVTTDTPPVPPVTGKLGETPWMRHNLTTMLITFDGSDAARGFSYFIVFNGDGPIGSGRYEDKFRKIDGRWLFAERKTRLEYVPNGEQWDAARAIAIADRQADAIKAT